MDPSGFDGEVAGAPQPEESKGAVEEIAAEIGSWIAEMWYCWAADWSLVMEATVTLYRPVGSKELELIRESGFRRFPPRLPEQPIFYPVVQEEYARKIARDWNVNASGAGYVTRFAVRAEYLRKYEEQVAGGQKHTEYWIPAEDLPDFNDNIVGQIEVVAEFLAAD